MITGVVLAVAVFVYLMVLTVLAAYTDYDDFACTLVAGGAMLSVCLIGGV